MVSTFLCRRLKFPQALSASWLLLHFEIQCIPNFSKSGSFWGFACKEFVNSVGHRHSARFLRKGSPAGKCQAKRKTLRTRMSAHSGNTGEHCSKQMGIQQNMRQLASRSWNKTIKRGQPWGESTCNPGTVCDLKSCHQRGMAVPSSHYHKWPGQSGKHRHFVHILA